MKQQITIAALAVGLVAAGCGTSASDEPGAAAPTPTVEEQVAAGGVEPGPTATPAATPEPSGPAPMPEPDFQEILRTEWQTISDEQGSIQEEMGWAPVLLEPGTYTTDKLLTPLTFAVDEHIRLIAEVTTFVALVDHENHHLWEPPFLEIHRPKYLVDPAETATGPPAIPGAIDGWDIDAWFAAHPGIDVVRRDVDVGGRLAVRYDLTYPEGTEVGWECDAGVRCVPFFVGFNGFPFDLTSDQPMSIWVVEQGDFRPIVLVGVSHFEDGWGGFADEMEAIVGSIELGDPAPVPFGERIWEEGLNGEIPAGPVWLPILGGVEFELPDPYFTVQAENWAYIEMREADFELFPPHVEIAAAIETFGGEPIGSAEQIAELLLDKVGGERLDDAEVAGQPAIVLDMQAVPPGVPVFTHAEVPDGVDREIFTWWSVDYMRSWIVDTPAGVLMLTADAGTSGDLELSLGLMEAVRTTLELAPRD